MVDKLNCTIPGKPEYIQMVRLAIGSVAGKFNFDVEKEYVINWHANVVDSVGFNYCILTI